MSLADVSLPLPPPKRNWTKDAQGHTDFSCQGKYFCYYQMNSIDCLFSHYSVCNWNKSTITSSWTKTQNFSCSIAQLHNGNGYRKKNCTQNLNLVYCCCCCCCYCVRRFKTKFSHDCTGWWSGDGDLVSPSSDTIKCALSL